MEVINKVTANGSRVSHRNLKGLHNFLVKPSEEGRYKNSEKIGDTELVVNTNLENHKYVNRYGEVEFTPKGYNGPIKKGDTLLVHHNTFRTHFGVAGKWFTNETVGDMFRVNEEQFFMYKNESGWHAHGRFCFVKPVKDMSYSFLQVDESYSAYLCEMAYPNDKLTDMGVKKGDILVYPPNTEYEFNVDGEQLFRLFDHQIAARYERV